MKITKTSRVFTFKVEEVPPDLFSVARLTAGWWTIGELEGVIDLLNRPHEQKIKDSLMEILRQAKVQRDMEF